jgi:hypothetical protein
MGAMDLQQRTIELRDEAFRLANELAHCFGAGPDAIEAATHMQSVAYLLGEVERDLADASVVAGAHEAQHAAPRLTAA